VAEQYGYAGKILRVDLSSGSITLMSTMDYAEKFLGGRGIAAKIYWDEVPPEVKAFDPENRLIFATGPLAGLKGVSGSGG
jgi:aldehyde:ferredoxin oxidoreductase